jgi:hypothetical protein
VQVSDDLVTWLRHRIGERKYLAEHAIELGNSAVWTELISGVLVTREPTDTDAWMWLTGDSSLTRLMEANDPRDTIARCGAELAILDACVPGGYRQQLVESGVISTEEYVAIEAMGAQVLRLLASGYRHRDDYRGEEW